MGSLFDEALSWDSQKKDEDKEKSLFEQAVEYDRQQPGSLFEEAQQLDKMERESAQLTPPPTPPPMTLPQSSISKEEQLQFKKDLAEYRRKVESGEVSQAEMIARGIPGPTRNVAKMLALTTLPASLPVGTGATAIATAAGTGAALGMGYETFDKAITEGRLPTPKEYAISGGIGSLAGLVPYAGPIVRKFSSKIKDVAKFKGVSPQQVNKELQQTVKAAREAGETISRGDVLDNMIHQTAQETPEGAAYFAKYLEEAAQVPPTVKKRVIDPTKILPRQIRKELKNLDPSEIGEPGRVIGKGTYPGISNLEGRVTQETAQTMLSPEAVVPARFDQYGNRITGKTVNLDKLAPDDKALQQQIDNMVNMFPDDAIGTNTRIANEYLRSRASQLPGSEIDDFFRRGIDAQLPANELRRITYKRIAAEDLFNSHAEQVTKKLGQQIESGDLSKMDSFINALEVDIKLARETGALRSEYGRGFQALKMTAEPVDINTKFTKDVAKVLNKLKYQGNLKDIARRMAQIDMLDPRQRLEFFRQLVRPSLRSKIDEIFYNSILSGPKTQMRNFLGNTGTIILREMERPFATTADLARSVITRTPRQRFYRESAKSAFGFIEGMREGVRAGYKSFVSEMPQFADDMSKLDYPGSTRIGGVIGGKTGRVVRIPSRLLIATDDFFKAIAYRMELNARAYREARKIGIANKMGTDEMLDLYNNLRANPTEYLEKAARDEAFLRTFQTQSGRIGKGLLSMRNALPGAEFLIPFVRTPLNIAEFAIERVPGPNLLSILNRKAQGLAIDWTEEAAKTAVGTMIGAGVYLAHKHGLINGFGPDERSKGKSKAFFAQGNQRYAINIGNTTVSFANFEPISSILGMTADFADMVEAGVPILSEDAVVNIGKSIARNVTSKSFGQGFETFFNIVNGDIESAKGGLLRTVGSGIPFSSLLRSTAMGLDPTIRTQRTFEDALRANIPGMRGDLEPIFDIWGNEVVTEAGVIQRIAESMGIETGMIGQILDALSSPITFKQITDDPATIEVNRLIKAFPEESFEGLGSPSREVKGVKLSRSEYIQYVKESGQLAHKAVLDLINAPWYDRLPDEKKKDMIESRIKKARKQTRNKLFGNTADND
ncbi:MAG: hypothetical protein C4555_03275 [Dehalococcoidia bacterium]|nr:MAG: hypothetical protein C4555_03275 [Dehalococcoidia bacterium]